MYLLDTNVISELRKVHSLRADSRVMRWAEKASAASLFLSVISVLELEIGVLRIERRDPSQGALFRSWLNSRVLPEFDNRILPIDAAVATRCAALHVPDPQSNRDSLIAATALVHGMTVVTRNTTDFISTGVALCNPWET